MRVLGIRVPLVLFPALLLTSNTFPNFCTATDTGRLSVSDDTAPSSARVRHSVHWDKRQASAQTPNLTACAKSCRARFLKYCHTRAQEGIGPAEKKGPHDVPGHHYSNNTDESAYFPDFRECVCSDTRGVVDMNSCGERCNFNSMGNEDVPDQVVELKVWQEGWCEDSIATTTIESISPSPSESGSLSIGSVQGQGANSVTSTPDHEARGNSHSAVLYAAVAVSVIVIFVFLFLVCTLVRRNKYARKRGLFAWLRLKLLEHQGYRPGLDAESSGSPDPAGLHSARETAMQVRVINGQTAVVGNSKWLNKAVPPLPPNQKPSESAREVVKEFMRDGVNEPSEKWGMFSLRGILGGGQPVSDEHRQRGPEQDQGRRPSYRYSLGWITAATRYIDDADEEGEGVQEYFRQKGITRPASSANLGPNKSDAHEGSVLFGATPARTVLAATYTQPVIGQVEKGYTLESSDGEDEGNGVGSEHGGLTAMEEHINYGEGINSSVSGRISPSQTGSIHSIAQHSIQTDISDVSFPVGTYRVGGMRSTSPHGQHEYHRDGVESFEEVDLSEGTHGYDDHDWPTKPDSSTNINTDHGGVGHDPNLLSVEPESQHNSDSDNGLKPATGKHKWRIGGRSSKGFPGLKRFGKRSTSTGEDSDSGRGSYKRV